MTECRHRKSQYAALSERGLLEWCEECGSVRYHKDGKRSRWQKPARQQKVAAKR